MDESFTTELRVRFRDIDAMHHVNNAVYATYLEQTRSEYFREVLGQRLDRVDTVLATLTIDYRKPIELEDETVEIALSIPELGTSSIPMEYELRTDDGIAATAETVQVTFDRETGESRPIPEKWRTRITEYEGL